jgi:hypothetical protein
MKRFLLSLVNRHKLPTVSDVDKLVQEISPAIDLAASKETLIWPGKVVEILAGMKDCKGGVWCSGAAAILQYHASNSHYVAVNIRFGFHEALTHEVTLILSKVGWIIADAYFGIVWDKPFKEAIIDLMDGIPVKNTGSGVRRKVHSKNILNSREHWAIGRAESNSLDKFNYINNHYVYEFHHDLEDFESKHPLMEPLKDILSSKGHPRDSSFSLLYPYGLVANGTIYQIHNLTDLIQKLKIYES